MTENGTPRLCEATSAMIDGACQSYARWVGPDGKLYCSMHFIAAFGHGERLQRIEDYEPPRKPAKAAAKKGARNG